MDSVVEAIMLIFCVFGTPAITFFPTFALAFLITPYAARLACWAGLVARVRPERLHREPKPYGGGIAIAISLGLWALASLLLMLAFADEYALREPGYWGAAQSLIATDLPWLPRLAAGSVLFFIVGLADDRRAFGAAAKMAIQFLAAGVCVVLFGLKATVWLRAPILPDAISILWIVAVVNAYNMLDHADGIAAAAGTAAFVALALEQLTFGDYALASAALTAAGALAGFLIYNFPPAKIFMGDAGSMFIGFLLAALTIQAQYYHEGSTPSRLVVLIPLALLAVPLFDMVCVVAARLWRRQNPMKGDATSHLAHRMLARGWSPRGIVAFAAGATAVTGAASASMYFLSGPALAAPWIVVAAVLAAMLLVRRPPHAQVARGSSQNQP